MKLVPCCGRGHPWPEGQDECLECKVQQLTEDRKFWRGAAITCLFLLVVVAGVFGHHVETTKGEDVNEHEARLKLIDRADRFAVVKPAPGREGVWIQDRGPLGPEIPSTWAIVRGVCVLNREFEWEVEYSPSNRSSDFIMRTRFTLADAIRRWEEYQELEVR